jgi:hypothetical protein
MNIVGTTVCQTGTLSFNKALACLRRGHGIQFSMESTNHLQARSKEESELGAFIDHRKKLGSPTVVLRENDTDRLHKRSICPLRNHGEQLYVCRASFGDLLREANTLRFYSHIFCIIEKESGFSMESTAILSLLLGFAMGESWKMSDYTPRVNRLCNKSLQFDALDAPSIEDLTTFVCHFFGKKLKCELPAFEHAPTPIDLRLATFPDNTTTHYPEPSSQRQ